MTCSFGFDDGAYVLGALSPADRAAYEAHLPTCAACRKAVASFAGLPGLLRRLGQPQDENPAREDRIPLLLKALKRKRRARQRRTLALVLSAFCAALALGAGLTNLPQDQPVMYSMDKVAANTNVTAEASASQTPGGTLIRMHCAYPDNGKQTRPYTFRLVAIGTDGTVEQVGSWKAGPGEEITITGTVQLGLDTISRIELRGRDGAVLLVLELSGS